MARRYGTRKLTSTATISPRCDWDEPYPLLLNGLTVDEHGPVDTGILDANGDMITWLPNPIGFGRDDEW
jgi:hypothetical protein